MVPPGCILICGPSASLAVGQEGSNVADEEGFSLDPPIPLPGDTLTDCRESEADEKPGDQS